MTDEPRSNSSSPVPVNSATRSKASCTGFVGLLVFLALCFALGWFVGGLNITELATLPKEQDDNARFSEVGSRVEPSVAGRGESSSDIQNPEEESKELANEVTDAAKIHPLNDTFPVQREFEKIDIRRYQQTYPNVHMGWVPYSAVQAGEAKDWSNYLGPLGVRVRSHVQQLQHRPAFAAIVPKLIQTQDGILGLNAAAVMSIAPDSPAEGHLKVGDLIVGVEGEMLLSGKHYRPELNLMHQDARELQLMLGEKIDQAQGRGEIRLTVLRAPKNEEQSLPFAREELWRGKSGDQSVGVQSFDVEIPGEGLLTLVSDRFDQSINGDRAMWMDVQLEGAGETVQLLAMEADWITAGYGRPEFRLDETQTVADENFRNTLVLHAQGTATWKVPEGAKRISGSFAAVSYGQVQPKIYFTPNTLPLTGWHQEHLVELRFPIGKAGSFSDSYPKDCPKTELTVARHTDWLAAQQREDGSWPRLRGYTRDGWDTAWCALALMSSGDSKYDAQIKKAAYKLAYDDAPSEWIAERAMRLIFLSEYYLRYKDDEILAGIQAGYYQVMDCCKTDFMSGHKVNGFGYGISGQHYGTGHLVLAVALASRTPITMNDYLTEGVIRHAGEVCVNGTYAYGRGRRMARNDTRRHAGGNAMSGPAVLGIQIGGGHSHVVKEHTERMLASLGDGDNSHATSSLAFIFSSLALAAADEDAFIKHMQAFRYKMTLDDNWEGGFLKSAFPLDYQGGEVVTSNWIRSAGSILVLNALKKELAITGKRELWNPDSMEGVPVSEWGGQIHSYYLRNWCLAKELLGSRAPAQLTQGIKKLHRLKRDMSLVPNTRSIVMELAPVLIRYVAKDRRLEPDQRAHAIELICGLDFRIFDEKKGNTQKVDLHVNLPLHELNWLDVDKSEMFKVSPFDLKSKIIIKAENFDKPIVFETAGFERFNLDRGTRMLTQSRPLKNPGGDQFAGTAQIAFKIGDVAVSYERPLRFNADFSHSNHYNLRRLKLSLKMAPRAYFQSQPMIIAGIPFDCMYPTERMPLMKGPTEEIDVNVHEGDRVSVDISSENMICGWVHDFQFEEKSQVKIIPKASLKAVRGQIIGQQRDLRDFDEETGCEIKADGSKAVLEYDFGRLVMINGLDGAADGASFIRVWYKRGKNWVPLVWDNYTFGTNHHPNFPDTKARFWRLEFQHLGSKKFGTLRFFRNQNRLLKYDALVQSRQQDAQPPIQPE